MKHPIERGVHQLHGRGVGYGVSADPTHARSMRDVAEQREDWAVVYYPGDPHVILFAAWRISASSWAWQTSMMAAPAFMPYDQTL